MSYKLIYFDLRGAAESSRLLFAIAGVEYEDFRFPIEFIDGRPESRQFKEAIEDGSFTANMGKLPVLETEGVQLGHSKAIERFLAKRFQMFGDSEIEAARIDAVCEHVRDIKDAFQVIRSMKTEEEKKVSMMKWYDSDLPSLLAKLETCLGEDECAVGTKLSLADICIFVLLTDFFENVEKCASAFKDLKRLSQIVEHVKNLDAVKGWIEKRPETMF